MRLHLYTSKEFRRSIHSRRYVKDYPDPVEPGETETPFVEKTGGDFELRCDLGEVSTRFNQTGGYPVSRVIVDWTDIVMMLEQFTKAGHPDAAKALAALTPPEPAPDAS